MRTDALRLSDWQNLYMQACSSSHQSQLITLSDNVAIYA
uniref:Uncharacterized protein n=1 Tax=Vibrio splendidus TaxID=29497 RepID=A0A0H3ZRJ7_VIBSP|nr:hypothetical protein [Vibrio splendidus]